MSPVLLGDGEHLFNDINLPALGFNSIERVPGERATHVVIRKA